MFATINLVITFNKFSFQVDSAYLWGILGLAILVFVVLAIILRFHWNNYTSQEKTMTFAKSLFWSVSFVLLISATVSLLVFELGI